jgi:peptidoglycan/xylan/chitin deacetylase (PgdA/CDA1 family)
MSKKKGSGSKRGGGVRNTPFFTRLKIFIQTASVVFVLLGIIVSMAIFNQNRDLQNSRAIESNFRDSKEVAEVRKMKALERVEKLDQKRRLKAKLERDKILKRMERLRRRQREAMRRVAKSEREVFEAFEAIESRESRRVRVRNPREQKRSKGGRKYSVFITSDDGPLNGSQYINRISLDKKVPITVFIVGKHINNRTKPYLKRYIENPYITLGNHSYSHAFDFDYKSYYLKPETVYYDFKRAEYELFSKLNINNSGKNFKKIFRDFKRMGRLPGRNVWILGSELRKGDTLNSLRAGEMLADSRGYRIYGWDYEIKDSKEYKGSAEELANLHFNKIKSLLKERKTYTDNQIVILIHDQMFKYSANSNSLVLNKLIDNLKRDKDITLKHLSQYRYY